MGGGLLWATWKRRDWGGGGGGREIGSGEGGIGTGGDGRGDRRGGEKIPGGGGGEEIERGDGERKRAHFGSANATAGTADFGRRTATATGHLSSSLLLLPSNLQFSCMKYLVLFAIYKIFLYPLGNNEKISVLFLVINIFLLESLFWRFFFCLHKVQFLDHRFASNVGSNGYNTRVAMGFHRFGW